MGLFDKIRAVIDEAGKLAEACGRPIEVLDGITISEVYAAMLAMPAMGRIQIEMAINQSYSDEHDPPKVEWKLWDGKKHFRGSTLKEAFLACQQFHQKPEPEGAELAAADASAIAPAPPF